MSFGNVVLLSCQKRLNLDGLLLIDMAHIQLVLE